MNRQLGGCRERYSSGKTESEGASHVSWCDLGFREQQAALLGQGKIGSGKFSKISIYSTGSCYHNDIPTGRESLLIETVDLPYSAAGAVTHHGMSQFLADGDPDTVALRTVWPGAMILF